MKICEITGKTAQVGNNVSHSNKKSKRRFNPNLKTKRFWNEEEGRWITLKDRPRHENHQQERFGSSSQRGRRSQIAVLIPKQKPKWQRKAIGSR